ncbi:MAG: MerR family DNA-binding protein [Bradyrhizobium sp.]|nr:MerR family DNA-binding protein [Bradyrhizobium sp.]
MSGTDGIDAAHREPHQDVGCGFDILQARHGSFQLSFAQRPGISDRSFADVARAEAADALHPHTRGGLLRPPARSGGQRIYDPVDVSRLAFIRRCRDFDLSIEAVGALLTLLDRHGSCTGARQLAERRLDEICRKLAELRALERALASLVRECAGSCDGGPAADCVILRPH